MANKFDNITATPSSSVAAETNINLVNEAFHVFSKSPASPTTSLGGARNKSGHTTTSSDVWADPIPAFLYAGGSAAKFESFGKLGASLSVNDLCFYNDSIYRWENTGTKEAPKMEFKLWKSPEQIVDGLILENKDGKGVIKYHKDRQAINLTATNNNDAGSDNLSAKIYDAPDSTTFVSQFVASTDCMVNGIPSLGYDAIVRDSKENLSEGFNADTEYLCNAYAGIIQFNSPRDQGTVWVSAYEYTGDKLITSLSTIQDDVSELEDRLDKISMTAAGGLQGASDAAKAAGLTEKWVKLVDNKEVEAEEGDEGAYPVVDITTAEFKDGIFVDNDDNKTKLVTAQDVTAFVNNHVKENSVKTISINDNTGQLAESFVADENNNISLGDGIDKVYNINRLFPDVRYTHENQSGLYDVNYDTVENGEKVWDDSRAITYLRYYFYMQDVAKFGCGPDEIYAAQDTASPKTDKNGNPLTIKDTISYQKMQGGLTIKYFRKVYGKSITLQGNWATRFYRGTKTRAWKTGEEFANDPSNYINPINWTWRPYYNIDTNEIKHQCILTGTDVNGNGETVGIGNQAQPGWINTGFDAFVHPNRGWDLIINGAELDEYNSEVSASGIKVVQAENLLDSITVTPATYTSKDGWNDVENVVTGSTVKTFVEHAVGEAKVTLTASTDAKQTGIIIDPNGTSSKNFTIGIDQSVIATVATVTAISEIIASNKGELDEKIAGINETIEALTSVTSTAIQGITINGGDDDELVKVEGNIVDITLPKNTIASDDSTLRGFRFSSHDADGNLGAGASGHYLYISSAEYSTDDKSWKTGTTNYFTTADTVEAFVSATVGADLTALQNKVNAYHEAGVSYAIYDKIAAKSELPDLSVPANVEKYKNVILLVPTSNIGSESGDDTSAITGGYVEWLCVNKGTNEAPSWDWEQIGTTEADLHGYVSNIDILNLNASGRTSPVYAEISSTGYLSLGIDSATSDKLGVSKLFTGHYEQMANVANKSNTAVSLETVSTMFRMQDGAYVKRDNAVNSINGVKGTVNLCVHNAPDCSYSSDGNVISGFDAAAHANLWGMGFVTNPHPSNDEDIILVDSFIGMSSSYLATANLPSGAVSVENNFVYDAAGGVITTIRPERMVSGFSTYNAKGTLKSFVGDLSNLESADLDGNAVATFYHCSALTSFVGDLSSLTNGSRMFESCNDLATFTSDLSSLTNGNMMFYQTNLSLESVECIADSINEHEGEITITWYYTPSEDKRQALVDELSRIVDKGWTLKTNYELLPLFDSEKYETGYDSVQPLDLDSEPQTVYYVRKK